MESAAKRYAKQLCSISIFSGWALTAEHRDLRLFWRVIVPNFVLKFAVLTFALCLLQLSALGQTYEWTGADNNQLWSDPANWSPTGVPGQTCTNCNADVPYPSGPYPIQNVSPLTLNNFTVATNERADMVDGDTLTLTGNTLSGYLVMNNAGGATTTLNINGNLIYTNASNGLGLNMENNSSILGSGTLSNWGTISYGGKQGNIGDGYLTLENTVSSIVISGGMGGSTSVLNLCTNQNWTNYGILEAENGATLKINCNGTITQSGPGQISADNAYVYLGGTGGSPTIVGGTLANPNGGYIFAGFGGSPTLSNLTNAGVYANATDGSSNTSLIGTITNNGVLTSNGGQFLINSPVTLSGTGFVLLSGSISGSSVLFNNQTIAGSGTIQVASLNNQGTIKGDETSATLTIQPGSGGVTNGGQITANFSGRTVISGGTVLNAGGTISPGGGFLQLTGGVTVVGGTIGDNLGNYVEGVSAILDGTSGPITIAGPFYVNFGDKTEVKGDFSGTGNIEVSGCPTPAELHASGNVVFDVNVTLGNDCSQNSFAGDGKNVVTIGAGNTLSGNGTVYRVNVVIDPKATLTAGYFAATPFTIDSSASLDVKGTDIVDPGVTEVINGVIKNFIAKTNTMSGGTFNVEGTLQLPGDIQTNNSNWTLTYPGQVTDQSGNNAFQGWTTNGSKGSFFLGPSTLQSTTPHTLPFLNLGKLGIGSGSQFGVNGGGSMEESIHGASHIPDNGQTIAYNQTGSTAVTTVDVDGQLTVPSGDLINFAGGTAAGDGGTFNGNVQVGNTAGGAAATFIVGDSTKKSASVYVSQSYTQLATGIMDVQIGGTNPGLQYSQLNVTGVVNLSGTLNIKLINKFKPSVGQTFTILNAPSGITGTFATVNGLSINSNEHFTITYNSTTIVLTVESGP